MAHTDEHTEETSKSRVGFLQFATLKDGGGTIIREFGPNDLDSVDEHLKYYEVFADGTINLIEGEGTPISGREKLAGSLLGTDPLAGWTLGRLADKIGIPVPRQSDPQAGREQNAINGISGQGDISFEMSAAIKRHIRDNYDVNLPADAKKLTGDPDPLGFWTELGFWQRLVKSRMMVNIEEGETVEGVFAREFLQKGEKFEDYQTGGKAIDTDDPATPRIISAREALRLGETLEDDPDVPNPFAQTQLEWVAPKLSTDDGLKKPGITDPNKGAPQEPGDFEGIEVTGDLLNDYLNDPTDGPSLVFNAMVNQFRDAGVAAHFLDFVMRQASRYLNEYRGSLGQQAIEGVQPVGDFRSFLEKKTGARLGGDPTFQVPVTSTAATETGAAVVPSTAVVTPSEGLVTPEGQTSAASNRASPQDAVEAILIAEAMQ